MGFNFRARSLTRDAHLYPQLPVKTGAPEDENCHRLVDDFLDLRATPVSEDLQRLASYINAAKYDRTGVDSATNAHRSQHRRSPSMMPVLARTPEFLPYLLANFLGSLKVLFHFSTKRWRVGLISLSLKAKGYLAWIFLTGDLDFVIGHTQCPSTVVLSSNQGPDRGEPPVHRNDLTCQASGAASQ